jgi:hypothetical protein
MRKLTPEPSCTQPNLKLPAKALAAAAPGDVMRCDLALGGGVSTFFRLFFLHLSGIADRWGNQVRLRRSN